MLDDGTVENYAQRSIPLLILSIFSTLSLKSSHCGIEQCVLSMVILF